MNEQAIDATRHINGTRSKASGPSLVTPSNTPEVGVFVPKCFESAIQLHIIKNYHAATLSPPLLLGIQGAAGEGKSFQAREICSRMGVYVIPVSGATLSGPYEKQAVEVLEEAYVFASSVYETKNQMTALLIDDFDMSVASTFDDRRYTVNSQLLAGFLMNLADDPMNCGSHRTCRVPLIVTGNNFMSVHKPLTRHGRMNFFHWKPGFSEKTQIVRGIFRSVLTSNELDKIEQLVQAFGDEPISFFSSLKSDMVDEALLQTIEHSGLDSSAIAETVRTALQSQNVAILIEQGWKRCEAIPRNSLSDSVERIGRSHDN